MKTWAKWTIGIVVVIIVLGAIGSMLDTETEGEPKSKLKMTEDSEEKSLTGNVVMETKEDSKVSPSKSWHKIIEINGKSDKVTDTFEIKGKKWKYTWSCNPDTTYGEGFDGMNIFAYPEGETALFVSSILMASCNEGDDTFVYEGIDSYYFDVSTANINSWKIVVEDYY